MSYLTYGAQLKAARELRQWSQAILSEQTGIPASRLSALETERRYPTEQEWEQLRECLRLGPYQPPVELPVAPRRCHTAPPAAEQAERTFAQRFHAAGHGPLVRYALPPGYGRRAARLLSFGCFDGPVGRPATRLAKPGG